MVQNFGSLNLGVQRKLSHQIPPTIRVIEIQTMATIVCGQARVGVGPQNRELETAGRMDRLSARTGYEASAIENRSPELP
jgi:hypothetical protein